MAVVLALQGAALMAQHYVPVGGAVDSTLVLPRLGGDSAYLVNEALTVTNNGVLRIEAGTKLFFGQSAYLRVDGGSLVMEGQASDSIYMLCYEFSYDWAGIQLKNVVGEGQVNLSHVVVMGALTALNATGCSNVAVNHCTFNNYYAGKGIELVDCSRSLVDSCFFYQCISGIELKARSSHCEDNVFSHSVFDKGQINIEVSNEGYGYKCHNNVISSNCFQGATTAISFESIGGLSDKDPKNYILNNLISSDLPEGGSGYSSYGIKAAMDSLVIRNNVFWHNDEAVTMLRACHLIFEDNTFYDNALVLTNLLSSGSANFYHNTLSEAQRRIVSFTSRKSRMNRNNYLHYKGDATLFANVAQEDIDMRWNYWDTQLTAEIDAVIIDKHDSPALGEIVYEGFLTECDTAAPISPPFKVKKQLVDGAWLVSWDDNPERDLDHYVLFYGDFNYYKFGHCVDSIFGNAYLLETQHPDNIAVMACDGAYNSNVYADAGQSAYAFATYYPYAGDDGDLCAPATGFEIRTANIPYTYSRFAWRTSGSGVFSDTLSLNPVYYPSEADFDAGEVTLTLRVVSNGVEKTDEMQLQLFKELKVSAGSDYFGGLNHPIAIEEAWADNYDSLSWSTLGDGHFEDAFVLSTVYHPGNQDKEQRSVYLVLEAWSYCGYACDTVRFELFEEFSLDGKTWANGQQRPNTQVVAAGLHNGNPFLSGFYRTVSDAEGNFKFESLLPDTYILYAFPDTLDLTVGGTYYLGDLQWNESNMILVDGDVYDVDIELHRLEHGFAEGEGRISGWFDYPDMPFKAHDFYCRSWFRDENEMEVAYCSGGLSNVGVVLLNATKQRILGFALTDASGAFRFRHLPFGKYYVLADVPRFGRGMMEEITISPNQPEVVDLHLFINANGRVAMFRDQLLESEGLYVFPNPSQNEITVIGLESLENYYVTVSNVVGDIVKVQQQCAADLMGEMTISIDALQPGLYFVGMESQARRKVVKFIKY